MRCRCVPVKGPKVWKGSENLTGGRASILEPKLVRQHTAGGHSTEEPRHIVGERWDVCRQVRMESGVRAGKLEEAGRDPTDKKP